MRRRDFIKCSGLLAGALLEGKLPGSCQYPRIYLDAEEGAFLNTAHASVDVSSIRSNSDTRVFPVTIDYNFFAVEDYSPYFFRGRGNYSVIAVTSPCLLIAAVSEKGSAVYHARHPWSRDFRGNICSIKDRLEKASFKAAGASYRDTSKIRQDLEGLLGTSSLVLGGGSPRITEFFPGTGKMSTYAPGETKNVF